MLVPERRADVNSLGFARGFDDPAARGDVTQHDIYPAFVDRVLSFIDPAEVKPLRVVIDAANGMAGAMLPPILDRLPVDAVRCFFDPDGTFPNHEPNPLLPENRDFIVAKVREENADLGIAFDGDADRCFLVDETGAVVSPSAVTALIATRELAKEAVSMAQAVLEGTEPEVNDTETYDNGEKVVPSFLLEPEVVTKDDVQSVLVDSGFLTAGDVGL